MHHQTGHEQQSHRECGNGQTETQQRVGRRSLSPNLAFISHGLETGKMDRGVVNLMTRQRIAKARLGQQHLPSNARNHVELPSLNLKRLQPTTSLSVTDLQRGSMQSGGMDDSPTSFRNPTASERHMVVPFESARKIPQGEKARLPVSGRHSPPRPWTPSSPTKDLEREVKHGRPHRPRARAVAHSGAVTERVPSYGRDGISSKSPAPYRGMTSARKSDDASNRSSRQTTPYVDIVGRHRHFDFYRNSLLLTRDDPSQNRETSKCPVDPAESYYQDKLKRHPNNTKLLREYACVLHGQRRFREADKQFRAALLQEPNNSTTLNAYAMLMWDQQKHSKSHDMLNMALKADPHCVLALLNAGRLSLHLGKLDSAIRFYSRALDIDHDHPAALLGCAVALEDHGDAALDEIEAIYLRVLRKNPFEFDALVSYGRFLKNRRNDVAKAESFYATALELQPQNVSLRCSYGVLLMQKLSDAYEKTYVKAANFFKTALELDPSHFDTTYNFAVLLSRWERAFGEPSFSAGAPASPLLRDREHQQEQNNLQQKKLQSSSALSSIVGSSKDRKLMAVFLYHKALTLKPKDQDLLCSLAIFLLNVPVYGAVSLYEAEHIFRRVLSRNPSHTLAVTYYCQLLRTHREGGHEKALEVEARASGMHNPAPSAPDNRHIGTAASRGQGLLEILRLEPPTKQSPKGKTRIEKGKDYNPFC